MPVQPKAEAQADRRLDGLFIMLSLLHAVLGVLWLAKAVGPGADPMWPLLTNDFVQGGWCLLLSTWLWLRARRRRPPAREAEKLGAS